MRSLHVLVSLLLMILNHLGNASCEVNINKKIVIIGAGPAGIAAASKLFENGFEHVTILEAEGRIGGRLHTTKLGNYSVDLGAQWVHGQKNNVVFEMANPLGLLDPNDGTIPTGELYDSSGNLVSSSINDNVQMLFNKYIIEDAPEHGIIAASSYGEFAEKIYEKEFQNEPDMIAFKKEILSFLEILELEYNSGDSWNDVSMNETDGYTVREGDQNVVWKCTGYGIILDILMKRYPDPDKELPVLNNTILNTEVTSIDYTNSANGHPIVITTKDNRTFEADHVIVTVSLGVLKAEHKSIFNPPLPDTKVDAIESLGFGNAGKVYFLFEEPFWKNESDQQFYGFLWNDDDRKAMEEDSEKMWLLGVSGALQVAYKPKLVEFFVSSKWAKMMEIIPENKVFNQSIELLERFLGKTHQIPKPVAMMRTQWYTNPHFRGTYSYHSVESDKRHIHPKMLQESITPDSLKILFAGEATSPHRFSTADGAIESGWTAAESLIKFYKTAPFE